MLQHKLEEGSAEVLNAIFSEVLLHIVELMMDPFGNYLCQKLMEMCSIPQLQLVLDKVCGSLVKISLNMHGARAVQKLIDVVRSTPHVPRLVAALESAVVALTKDPNGNHVVQRCLEALPVEAHSFIFKAVASEVVEVASHRHGCRIVQRCIDAAVAHDRSLLVGAICRSTLTLVQDPFGNYVVQYVLGLQDQQANAEIVRCLSGRLGVLSRQKFSSNVVERCLQLSGPEERLVMIRELADTRVLGELLRDVFGNYVVQSALTITPEPELSHFLGCIRPLLPSLRANGQGRRIAQKLEKKYPQLRGGGGGGGAGGGAVGGGGSCGGCSGGGRGSTSSGGGGGMAGLEACSGVGGRPHFAAGGCFGNGSCGSPCLATSGIAVGPQALCSPLHGELSIGNSSGASAVLIHSGSTMPSSLPAMPAAAAAAVAAAAVAAMGGGMTACLVQQGMQGATPTGLFMQPGGTMMSPGPLGTGIMAPSASSAALAGAVGPCMACGALGMGGSSGSTMGSAGAMGMVVPPLGQQMLLQQGLPPQFSQQPPFQQQQHHQQPPIGSVGGVGAVRGRQRRGGRRRDGGGDIAGGGDGGAR